MFRRALVRLSPKNTGCSEETTNSIALLEPLRRSNITVILFQPMDLGPLQRPAFFDRDRRCFHYLVPYLHFCLRMKVQRKTFGALVVMLIGVSLFPPSSAMTNSSARFRLIQTNQQASEKQVFSAFENRVKKYVKLREALESKMIKLSKDATPEQIDAYKVTLQNKVKAARAGAKRGEFFATDIASLIRVIIKDEFKGRDRVELRQTVFEAETQGVKVLVNQPYPAGKELLEMPPTLLLRLPQLPKQVKYRFVGPNLLLVDRENGLILDYMVRAVP